MMINSNADLFDEYDHLVQEDPPAGVSGAPGENNILLWNAVIFGPHETPFEVSIQLNNICPAYMELKQEYH